MKTITIVFTKSKKKFAPISKAIMWWTGVNYSHVARKGKLPFVEKPHYYHAAEGNVHYSYEDNFISKNEIVKEYEIEVSNDIYTELVKTSWEQCGSYYGFMQNIGIFMVDLLQKVGIRATNPFKKNVNCSELIFTTVFQKMLPNLPYRKDTIKPHHIEEIITTNNLAKNITND